MGWKASDRISWQLGDVQEDRVLGFRVQGFGSSGLGF